MVEKRFEESRSRSPKDCVHRGLGLRLNKQKNHSFHGSGMDGFSHLYYRCIACGFGGIEIHLNNEWQHRTIASATFSGAFTLEIRYFFLKYTKYSCEKLPFSTAKSPAECSCRIMRYCLISNAIAYDCDIRIDKQYRKP